MEGFAIFGLIIAGWLVFQKGFWIFASWLGMVASFFAMLASIVSFQILGAIGFLFLFGVCYFIALVTSE